MINNESCRFGRITASSINWAFMYLRQKEIIQIENIYIYIDVCKCMVSHTDKFIGISHLSLSKETLIIKML